MFTCLVISFIFSALNLGLMALDVNELQMLINSGTNVEQKYARRILPVRRNGNYLLCCILLCLTLTNAIFTTILDSLTSGRAEGLPHIRSVGKRLLVERSRAMPSENPNPATSNLVALKKDEVNIISGALEMTQKKVEEIMTKLDDCYMLDIETILNFTVISEIVRT
ncbi:metal transporter CNNM2-like, partial [Diaphorina citri]|uniref:Metal transporter CNNM2-like n=1 Tax=Diaphorina citri TaxID=121845 RepID=A0A1S3DDZ3_DIACI